MSRNDLLIACALCSPICSPQAAQGCTVTASHKCSMPVLAECHRLSGKVRGKRRHHPMYRGLPRREKPGKKTTSRCYFACRLVQNVYCSPNTRVMEYRRTKGVGRGERLRRDVTWRRWASRKRRFEATFYMRLQGSRGPGGLTKISTAMRSHWC